MVLSELEKDSRLSIDRLNFEGSKKSREAFQQFWEECKNQISNDSATKMELDCQLTEWPKQSEYVGCELAKYRDFACQIPVCVAVCDWIKGQIADHFWKERYLSKMLHLQQRNIIPIVKPDGKIVTLEYFMYEGHQDVLEKIRCVKQWSILEKEDLVQCYIQFSRYLFRRSSSLIPQGYDPDRERLRFKAVKYDVFIDFVDRLSERDALIAKLLYFGAPSIDEVLSLKKDAVELQAFSIQFQEGIYSFPRHLVEDLILYITAKASDEDLVFTNLRKAQVERTHLNQSFSRACEKMSTNAKITPGLLLRLESEKIDASAS